MLTPPTVVDQVYVVKDPAAFYVLPEFENSDSVYCPIEYKASFDQATASWLHWNASGDDTRRMDWFLDSSDAAVYDITFTVTGLD